MGVAACEHGREGDLYGRGAHREEEMEQTGAGETQWTVGRAANTVL